MNNNSISLTLTLSHSEWERGQQVNISSVLKFHPVDPIVRFLVGLHKILPLPGEEGRGEGKVRRSQIHIFSLILVIGFVALSALAVSPPGNSMVSNVAGTGAKGFSGDGG